MRENYKKKVRRGMSLFKIKRQFLKGGWNVKHPSLAQGTLSPPKSIALRHLSPS